MEKNSQIKKEEKRMIAKLQDLQQENARFREALDKHRDFYSRFWSKVNVLKKNECWEWLSSISPNGYGKFSIDNYPYSSHVLSYKFYNDNYDENLCIDHICMNRKCVNPRHLRQVTKKINNTENSNGTAALNKRKTHCPTGHEYSGGNLIIKKTKTGEQRRCRICVSKTAKRAREALVHDFMNKENFMNKEIERRMSGHNHALTIEKLRKLRELLEREPPFYVEYKFDSKKKIEKTLEERIEESNRMIKKWDKSE
jgi:hypothetical protein